MKTQRVHLQLRISEEEKQRIQAYAKSKGLSLSTLVTQYFRDILTRVDEERAPKQI